MPLPSPAERARQECDRRGPEAFVHGCVELLDGAAVDAGLLAALGGAHAAAVLEGRDGGPTGYWPRVWAARGLLHVWDDVATPAVVRATGDDSWRVREMAAKVVARHRVGAGLEAAARMAVDPVPRVRRAAARAIERLVTDLA